MKKILHIVSSAKGKDSFSKQLSTAILEELQSVYPGSTVKTRDLTKNPLPHLEQAHITSFFTPEENRTDDHKEAIQHSNKAIKELMEADILVIAAPLYNFGIPSTLKAWIDHIARAGVTFSYVNGLPVGLVTDKKVYLAIASGGIYSEGPMKSYDFAEPYLKAVLGFIGMKDIATFRIEGTSIPIIKDLAWPKALESVNSYAFSAIEERV